MRFFRVGSGSADHREPRRESDTVCSIEPVPQPVQREYRKEERDENSGGSCGAGLKDDRSVEGDKKQPCLKGERDCRASIEPCRGLDPGPGSVGDPEQHEEVAEPESLAEGKSDDLFCLDGGALHGLRVAPVMSEVKRSGYMCDEQQSSCSPQWPHDSHAVDRGWLSQIDDDRDCVAQQCDADGP